MSVSEKDILRSAKLLIVRHGDQAWMVAARRVDDLLAAGDVEGSARWGRILKAINTLSGDAPPTATRH